MPFDKKEHLVNGDGGHMMLNDLEERISQSINPIEIELSEVATKINDYVELSTVRDWHIEKYADGRLKMWKRFNIPLTFAAHATYYFRGVAGVNDSFPIQFVGDVNAAVNIGKLDASGASIWKGRTAISNTQVNQILFFADGAVTQDVTFVVDAIGYWK